jgi:hypothetical protein
VVGYIALFCFVLGGTAVALPGKNKVDTGDIKKNAVRAADIAPKAVTAAKIAPRSVDSLKVIDDSLGGADIDESTLDIRPAPSSIGPTELADRQRRLVYSPGALVPDGAEPESLGSFAVMSFPDVTGGVATLSADVPGGRVEGTKLTVRLIWSASGNGAVVWDVTHNLIGIGGSTEAILSAESTAVVTTTINTVVATSFEIPGGSVRNGDLLGLAIERDANESEDTLTGDARLHLVEIDYTANG